MRRYPVNSPQAAARIVALTVIADGDIGEAEIEWLDRLSVHEQLGLARHELHTLLDTFCEDLLSSGQLNWADACPVDECTLADLMGEIQDPSLRLKLLRWCGADRSLQSGFRPSGCRRPGGRSRNQYTQRSRRRSGRRLAG